MQNPVCTYKLSCCDISKNEPFCKSGKAIRSQEQRCPGAAGPAEAGLAQVFPFSKVALRDVKASMRRLFPHVLRLSKVNLMSRGKSCRPP